MAADNLPAVDIVATAVVFAAVPDISVDVPLVLPAIDLGGRRWPAYIIFIVSSRYFLRLYVRLG